MALIEFATGSDNFPKVTGYESRSVQLTALVYNTKSGLFENPRSLTNGGDVCKVEKVLKAMPASTVVTCPGNWYYYRTEARGGSLWAFEVKRRTGGPFSFESEILLVRFNKSAPLYRVQLALPEHPYANVTELDFMWNCQQIRTHEKLLRDELLAFKKLVGEQNDLVVEFTQDPAELPSWKFTQIEKAAPKTKKVVSSQNKPVAIQRVRKLRL